MHQDSTLRLYTSIYKKLTFKWPLFLAALTKAADADDRNQICINDFVKVCKTFDVKLTEKETSNIINSYPGRGSDQVIGSHKVNIYPLYDTKYNMRFHQMYKKVDCREGEKCDDAIDASGFTGIFHRVQRKLHAISESEFIAEIAREGKLKEVFFDIRTIDKDRNGFVTTVELDDILKEVHTSLEDRDLSEIIKPFCSKENKILVDYKKFRAFLVNNLQLHREKEHQVDEDTKNEI